MTELSSQVAARVGVKAAPAEAFKAAADIARDALQKGEAVDLLGLVRLRLTASGLSGKSKEADAVHADPIPGLLPGTAIGEHNEIIVLIAVERTDRFSEMLATRLNAPGRRAIVAEGLAGVMDEVKKNGADIVILDSGMEMADEIRQWLKSSPERSLIALVAVYESEEALDNVKGFRVCEDEFLCEPYEMQTLENIITGEITRISMERKYFLHEVSFQFPTENVYQQQAADFMEKLAAHSGLSEPSQMGLVVAFREAVDNASRHGNKSSPNSIISVAYVLDREKVTVTVQDEGPGFDTSRYLETRISGNAVEAARARHAEGRQGGLGIMLMLKSVDRMEYNRDGNVIKLTRYLKPRAKK